MPIDVSRGMNRLENFFDGYKDIREALEEIHRVGGLDRATAAAEQRKREAEAAEASAAAKMNDATAELDAAHDRVKEAKDKADRIVRDAKTEAGRLEKSAHAQYDKRMEEAAADGDRIIEQARKKAEGEKSKIAAERDALRNEINALSKRKTELAEEASSEQARVDALKAEADEVMRRFKRFES